jgi:hypothetical protein
MRPSVALALLMMGACSHSVGSPPPASQPVSPPPAAASLGPGHGQTAPPSSNAVIGGESAATSGALPGIEKFDRPITPLTVICGADTYNVRYSQIAQNRFGAALAARPGAGQTARIDRVDMRLRCHSQGLGGMESRCYGDATIALTLLDKRTGASLSPLEVSGRSSEAIVFTCSSGGQAIGQALDNALGRMSDNIIAAK